MTTTRAANLPFFALEPAPQPEAKGSSKLEFFGKLKAISPLTKISQTSKAAPCVLVNAPAIFFRGERLTPDFKGGNRYAVVAQLIALCEQDGVHIEVDDRSYKLLAGEFVPVDAAAQARHEAWLSQPQPPRPRKTAHERFSGRSLEEATQLGGSAITSGAFSAQPLMQAVPAPKDPVQEKLQAFLEKYFIDVPNEPMTSVFGDYLDFLNIVSALQTTNTTSGLVNMVGRAMQDQLMKGLDDQKPDGDLLALLQALDANTCVALNNLLERTKGVTLIAEKTHLVLKRRLAAAPANTQGA